MKIKNDYKKIFIVAAVALAAAGCNVSQKAPPVQQSQNSGQQGTAPAPQLQTYINGTYGFKFEYPASMVFVTPTYANLEDKAVQIEIPQSAYPKTNFGDASFSVSTAYAKSLQDCLNFTAPVQNSASSAFKETASINGVNFYMAKGSDAGAGNYYNSTIYRTLTGQHLCVELDETIHTANIQNFPAGAVTEVDSAAVQKRLDAVLNTFQFVQQ